MDRKIDAIFIAAGGRKKVGGEYAPYLEVAGTPVIRYVIDAVLDSGVENAYVWIHEKEKLEAILDNEEKKTIKIIEGAGSVADNIINAFFYYLKNQHRIYININPNEWSHIDYIKKTRRDIQEMPVLMVPCDTPFITSREINEYIDDYNGQNVDYMMGFTSKNHVDRVMGNAGLLDEFYNLNSTIKNFTYLKDAAVRINNLHVMKPLKMSQTTYRFVQGVFNLRYASNPMNWPKILDLWRLFKEERDGERIKDIKKDIGNLLLSQSKLPGFVANHFKEKNSLKKIEDDMSYVLGLNASINVDGGIGSYLDCDDKATLEFVNKHFFVLKQGISSGV